MITDFTPRRLTLSQIKKVHTLLRNDFHRAEIKPWLWILKKTLQKQYDGYALFEGENIAAYALFYNDERTGFSLLDYLAVCRDHRAKGAGSQFLQELVKLKPDMVLETENPTYAEDEDDKNIRVHRLGFYHRNGFVETGILASVFGEKYRMLQNGASSKSIITIPELETLYSGMFSRAGVKSVVKLTEENGGCDGVHIP